MDDNLKVIFNSILGINNKDDPKNFPDDKPFLVQANNVDLTRTGEYKVRPSISKIKDLTYGHSGEYINNMFLYADDTRLYKYINGVDDEVLTYDLINNHDISYTEINNEVYLTNNTITGRISNGIYTYWGLSTTDKPTLSVSSGVLLPGKYRVAVTSVVNGMESGAKISDIIELTTAGGISGNVTNTDTNAEYYNLYISDTNGEDLFYLKTIYTTNFNIVNFDNKSIYLFQGKDIYPPPAGTIVRSWNGFLMVVTDSELYGNSIYFSQPGAYHRFKLKTDLFLFKSKIVLLEPVEDGFYVGLDTGETYFYSGTDIKSLKVTLVDTRKIVNAKSIRIEPRKTWLDIQYTKPIPIWATEDGFVAGLPDGNLSYATEETIAMDVNSKGSIAYVERPGLSQILLSARNKVQDSSLQLNDYASLTVTRNGIQI